MWILLLSATLWFWIVSIRVDTRMLLSMLRDRVTWLFWAVIWMGFLRTILNMLGWRLILSTCCWVLC